MCFPRSHRVEWTIDLKARNLLITVTGHLRLADRNESVEICKAKFEHDQVKTIIHGSFDRTGKSRGYPSELEPTDAHWAGRERGPLTKEDLDSVGWCWWCWCFGQCATPRALARSLTHSLAHSLTRSLTRSLAHSLAH